MELYHSQQTRRLYTFAEASAPDEQNVGQLHLFVGRKWVDEGGQEFDLSGDAFDQMIENFDASESKTLSVDYDHRAWHPTHPDSKAAGWVRKLFTRQGSAGFRELWAEVEWTKPAADAIRAKEWRFCSPAFVLADKSNKTGNDVGARLLNVALTNIPFQDGLTPIKLSLASDRKETAMPDDKPREDDASGQLNAFVDLVAEAAGIDRMAAISALSDRVEEIGAMVRQALDKDGMPSDEPKKDAEPAQTSQAASSEAAPVQASQNAAPAAPAAEPVADEARLLRTEVAALTAQVQTMSQHINVVKAAHDAAESRKADERKASIEREADAIIADGRALDSQRDDVVYMLTHAPERAARLFSVKVVPLGTSQAGTAEPAPAAPSDPVASDVATLSERERGVYESIVQMGKRLNSRKDAGALHKFAMDRIGLIRSEQAAKGGAN